MEIVTTVAILVPDEHWIFLRETVDQHRVLISWGKGRIVHSQTFGSKPWGCSVSIFLFLYIIKAVRLGVLKINPRVLHSYSDCSSIRLVSTTLAVLVNKNWEYKRWVKTSSSDFGRWSFKSYQVINIQHPICKYIECVVQRSNRACVVLWAEKLLNRYFI